jgi:hypothetical protein
MGLIQTSEVPSSEALRTTDYEDALQKAKAGDCDIVLLQRGSDRNVLSERILTELWSKESFAKSLGKGFVLVTVDRPESHRQQSIGQRFRNFHSRRVPDPTDVQPNTANQKTDHLP